jgi:hypothetical protein
VAGKITRRGPALELLEQAGLADARLAAKVDRLRTPQRRQAATGSASPLISSAPAGLQTKRSGNRRRTASEIRISPLVA